MCTHLARCEILYSERTETAFMRAVAVRGHLPSAKGVTEFSGLARLTGAST